MAPARLGWSGDAAAARGAAGPSPRTRSGCLASAAPRTGRARSLSTAPPASRRLPAGRRRDDIGHLRPEEDPIQGTRLAPLDARSDLSLLLLRTPWIAPTAPPVTDGVSRLPEPAWLRPALLVYERAAQRERLLRGHRGCPCRRRLRPSCRCRRQCRFRRRCRRLRSGGSSTRWSPSCWKPVRAPASSPRP